MAPSPTRPEVSERMVRAFVGRLLEERSLILSDLASYMHGYPSSSRYK